MCDFLKPKSFLNIYIFITLILSGIIGAAVPDRESDLQYWREQTEEKITKLDTTLQCNKEKSDQTLEDLKIQINTLDKRLVIIESKVNGLSDKIQFLLYTFIGIGAAGAGGTAVNKLKKKVSS